MDLRTRLRDRLARLSRGTPMFRLKTRVLRKLDAALRRARPTSLTAMAGGATFLLDTEELIQFMTCYFGGYDVHVREALIRLCGNSSRIVWDIGANVGAVSLPLAARCRGARVFAFEPSPRVRSLLERNVALNPSSNSRYTVLPLALSDHTGTTQFYESNESFNGGVGSLARAANTVAVPVTVGVCRGDDLIAQGLVPVPDIIKIDVEGFEYEVLEGLHDFLESGNPASIIFENSPYRLRERGRSGVDIIGQLVTAGFSVTKIEHDGRSVPLTPSMHEQQMDCLAQRG